jgi:hypothetical protein
MRAVGTLIETKHAADLDREALFEKGQIVLGGDLT